MADSRIPELIADLEAQAIACLLKVDSVQIDKLTATHIAKHLTHHLTYHWGGQLIYFPKNHGGALDERDQQIYAEFNGKNHHQLAKKYHLATQQIYKIIKQVGEKEMTKRQISLFG